MIYLQSLLKYATVICLSEAVLILPQRLVRSPAVNQPLKHGVVCSMLLPCLLYPVSAPLSMHAKASWPPQLENAAQMSPALLHVCCVPLTGNERGRKSGLNSGTQAGHFNLKFTIHEFRRLSCPFSL